MHSVRVSASLIGSVNILEPHSDTEVAGLESSGISSFCGGDRPKQMDTV